MARELDGTEIKELVRLIQRRFDKNEFSAFFYMDVDDKVRFDDFVAAQDVWKVQLANFLQYTDRKNLSVALVAALAAKPEMDASEKGWLEKLSSALITAKEPVADNPDERQLWQEASVSSDPSVIEDFLTRFPGGRYTAMAQARADERIADCGDARVLERFIKRHGASPRRVEAEARLAALTDADAPGDAGLNDKPRLGAAVSAGVFASAWALRPGLSPRFIKNAVVLAALAIVIGVGNAISASGLVCHFVSTTACLQKEISRTEDRVRLREISDVYPHMAKAVSERISKLDLPLIDKIMKSEDRGWLLQTAKTAPELQSIVARRIDELDGAAMPQSCAHRPGYPMGRWNIAVPDATTAVYSTFITFTRANGGIWRSSSGDEESFKVDPGIAPGSVITLTYETRSGKYSSTNKLVISRDGCGMTGSFNDSQGRNGDVVYSYNVQ